MFVKQMCDVRRGRLAYKAGPYSPFITTTQKREVAQLLRPFVSAARAARASSRFDVRAASAGSGVVVELRLDGVAGPLVGKVNLPVTGGWQKWTTVSAPVSGAGGQHDLYVVFRGTTDIGNVNWFRFK